MSLREASWLTAAALILFASFSLVPAAAQAPDVPPVIPVDIRPDPSFENISYDTNEVTFEIQLYRWDDSFTGDYSVTTEVNEELVAEINGLWEPGTTHKNVSTVEDADDGPGTWEPTIGLHQINITTEARGESFPIPLNVPMGPDLRPGDVQMSPEHPLPGDEVTFTLEVINQGTWAMPDDVDVPVTLSVENESLGEQSVANLDSRENTTLTFETTWTAQEGTHEVHATVDPDRIPEVRNENNERTQTITIESHTLETTRLVAEPVPAEPGETVTVTATVQNLADREADEETVALYQSGQRVAEDQTPILGPGEEATLEWETQAADAPGQHELKAVVDPGDAQELPEDATGPTFVLSVGPDFGILDVRFSDREPVEGDNVTLEAVIENHGTATEQTVPVVVYLIEEGGTEEEPLDGTEIDGLGAGAEKSVSFEFTPPVGEHLVVLHVDPVDDVQEASRDDNRAEVPLHVRPDKPVPRIENLTIDDPAVQPGQEARMEIVVSNEGGQPANELYARFLLDGEPLGEPEALDRLGPGETTQVTSEAWTTRDGLHALTVQIGNSTQFEAENPVDVASTDVLVEGPTSDLALDELRWEPEDPTIGTDVTLLATVTNEADEPRSDVQVHFLVDGSPVSTETIDELEPGASADVESEAWTLEDDEVNVTATLGDEATSQHDGANTVHATVTGDEPAPVPVPAALALVGTMLLAGALGRRRA